MEKLNVYQKWEDMTQYLYIAMRQYPKSERFTLAAETVRCAFDIGSAIARANVVSGKESKRRYVEHADIELSKLKILVRMGMKLEFLPMKKYEILGGQLTEIGKMFGGWIRSIA